VVAAAKALAAALTTAQQTTIQLDYTLANVQQWSNLPTSFIPRDVVMLGDMSTAAAGAAISARLGDGLARRGGADGDAVT
jgi:hypothetical protein